MLSDRQKKILQFLKKRGTFIPVGEIAGHFHFSPRTIRNDLAGIREFMVQNQYGEVQAKPRKGIRLITTEEKWDKLQSVCRRGESAPPAERRKYEICRILLRSDTVQMSELEKQLYLGRLGVEKALGGAELWLGEKNIKLRRVRGKGLWAECPEFSRRLAYLELYRMDGGETPAGEAADDTGPLRRIRVYFNGFNAIGVLGSLNETEKKYGFHFEYRSRQNLFF